jgi:hypothetical protein
MSRASFSRKRRIFLATRLGFLFLVGTSFLLGGAHAQAQAYPASQLIQLVNQLRISYGQTPYQVDPILMSVAQAQATYSAANCFNGHTGPDGSGPDERARAAGYGEGYNSFATENAASGTLELHTPELVVSFWQMDYGHLTAMISPKYEHIGVGYAEGFGMSWYIMMVGWIDDGSPASAAPVDTAPVNPAFYPPFVVSTPDESGAIYHEVQPGQAAWTIAVYYEIDLAELLALNNLTEDSILHPGDLLLIRPTPTQTSTPEPSLQLPTVTPIPTATPKTSILATRPSPSPGIIPSLTPSLQGISASRSPLLVIAVVIGLGLILLVGITILTRPRRP